MALLAYLINNMETAMDLMSNIDEKIKLFSEDVNNKKVIKLIKII